jgi:transposase
MMREMGTGCTCPLRDYVDTSAEKDIATDSLGRRTGPRRPHSVEEKRRIVEETHVRGASVAAVARRHGLNANQVFAWRRLERQGLLDPKTPPTAMLPVKVSTPTVLPSERVAPAATKSERRDRRPKLIEIKLANGHSILLHGRVHGRSLARVIDLLLRR